MKKKIVAIIPARSGSKGLRNKNIKLLGGYPLLAWSIIICKKTKREVTDKLSKWGYMPNFLPRRNQTYKSMGDNFTKNFTC